MNKSSYDEYEEVESPFAAKTTEKLESRERLRTRKNVFNRPFATETTSAPLIVDKALTRKSIGQVDSTEMLRHRQSELNQAEIDYLDEEEEVEEVVEKRPVARRNPSPKKVVKSKKNLLPKIGWSIISLLVLRLIFMERGVWDYFSTESEIREKKSELRSIQKENLELKTEISKIQLDKNYQRQLAKEHLGVIAADEFLILFAGESADSTQNEDEKNFL